MPVSLDGAKAAFRGEGSLSRQPFAIEAVRLLLILGVKPFVEARPGQGLFPDGQSQKAGISRG